MPLASERYEPIVPAQGKLPPMFLELIAATEIQQAVEALDGPTGRSARLLPERIE